jgi:hypothetical protein
MKRLDLVQLTIIIVGIFSGFYFIISLPQFLYFVIEWFEKGLTGGYYMQAFFINIIMSASYLAAAFYCIKRSKHLAGLICSNASLDATINFNLAKNELLFLLFTGIGIYGIIKNLPKLLVDGFIKIKSNNSLSELDKANAATGSSLAIQILTVLLFFTLAYYAKVFADFLAAKINNTEPDDSIAQITQD